MLEIVRSKARGAGNPKPGTDCKVINRRRCVGIALKLHTAQERRINFRGRKNDSAIVFAGVVIRENLLQPRSHQAIHLASQAITNTAIAVSGTNIVLSWPSYGYESYLIQYRQTLAPTDSWSQVVNAYPANSTNRTTYTLYGLATPAIVGSGGGSNYGVPPLPSFASSSLASATITTASGASATISASTAAEAAATGSPLAIPADGSSVVPLALYPPHFDLAGFTILDPVTGTSLSGADYQAENPDFNTSDSGNTPQPMDGGGGSGGQSDPTTGFFRVFHIPDWLADFSGYTFDGPTFIPVDYESPDAAVDYVDSTTVLINGQPTDNAMLTPYVYNGVTNWGVGIYFDRFPNGTATIQLITTVRQSDTLNDQTPYMVFSNNPVTITIGNAITFTNWSDIILSNTYIFNAQSTTPNVNWEIDIYDVNGYFVNSQTGFSSDGNIAWTWDMTDYTGASRMDDSDPFFYPEVTITPTTQAMGSTHPNDGGGSTTRATPAVAAQFPSSGSWLFSYLDNDYDDGTTNYPGGTSTMLSGIHEMEGGPIEWSIGTWEFPITDQSLAYTTVLASKKDRTNCLLPLILFRSSSMRTWSDSFRFKGFLDTPLFFMWLHTNSSGFKSGA